jgi:quinol monooxygenase YgiN
MVYVHVRHNVEDYERWREGFDDHAPVRQASGATDETYVMRGIEDPNALTVIMGWTDLEKARAFTQSPDLKDAMQKAGVTGPPEVSFLEAVS